MIDDICKNMFKSSEKVCKWGHGMYHRHTPRLAPCRAVPDMFLKETGKIVKGKSRDVG